MNAVVLPSARLFVGPGHDLFGFDRIWVMIHRGRHHVIGKNGDERHDERFLSYTLGHLSKGTAARAFIHFLTHFDNSVIPCNQYHNTPHRYVALKGDTPLVWTVDFDRSCIFYDRDGLHLIHHFDIPDHCPLRLRHFQPYVPMQLPPKSIKEMQKTSSISPGPADTVPSQLFDLVYRLASDYEQNWRVQEYSIERYGIQQLAFGILSCFSMNFKVEKGLLRWRAWSCPPVVPTVSFENTHILFTERIDEASMLVNEHFASMLLAELDTESQRSVTAQYIVTSIEKIQYFQKSCSTVVSTLVIPFFTGKCPPSKTSVRWMLNAIHGHAYPLHTPIHDLPVEMQELILDHVSNGSEIDRAYYASVLGIGIPFTWKEDPSHLRLYPLNKWKEPSDYDLVHQVIFWDEYVGLIYRLASDNVESQSNA